MLISHSIIPSLIIIIIGVIFSWPAIFLGGVGYFVHIMMDTLDWGTNVFGFHKSPVGPKILISSEELKNLSEILENYKPKFIFYDERYYKNKILMGMELIIFLLMVIFLVIYALDYILVVVLYFGLLAYHLICYLIFK